MKKENWELEWIKFVREVMCPARCGRLRFKVKKLIQGIRDKQKEEIKEKVANLYMHTNPFKKGDETNFYKKINKELNK